MIDIAIDGFPYPVIVTDRPAAHLNRLLEGTTSVVAVVDKRVDRHARALITASTTRGSVRLLGVVAVRGGEQLKSARALAQLWHQLARYGVERRTVLLAIGGGTVTDLAGFAAATFLRGIQWIALPTTVLGMADAAIGGKTAIDLPEGKNLAGAFWPPRGVVADLGALRTLPETELRTGVAEIVKAAVIGDPPLLDLVEALRAERRDAGTWVEPIAAAARVKVAIVAADPLEQGRREALNLGHTLGHAVERASRGRLPHGSAVAIGLRAAGLLALRRGMFSAAEHARVLRALRHAGLPLHYGAVAPRTIEAALRVDKKRRDGVLRCVLPERIGAVRTGVVADAAEIRAVIAQCGRPPRVEELGA